MKDKKKLIKEERLTNCGYLDLHEISTTFNCLREFFDKTERDNPEFFDFRLEVDHYYDDTDIEIYAKRYETDVEYDQRIKTAAKRKITDAARNKKKEEETKQRELKQLAKLKEKYERQT